MFGWTASHIPLILALPLLLIGSAFFSGSETALFGLTHGERVELRRRRGIASGAIDALLANPRMLLITILLGNMVINVLYFVISSVLLIAATDARWIERVVLAALSLLAIILLGEVTPKLLANTARITTARFIAPIVLAVHRLLAPIRIPLNAAVVEPLSRLTAPTSAPPALDHAELAALFESSREEGLIDEREQQLLREVIELDQHTVRSAMTPRVKMAAVPIDATRDDVAAIARETRLTKLPVHEGDLDHIVGILHVKRFLLDDESHHVRGSSAIVPVRYIPELATLDRLLDDFRRTHTQLAIAVDEYGGTAGIIAIEDIVREIMGDLWEPEA